jgi:hypothetical protein
MLPGPKPARQAEPLQLRELDQCVAWLERAVQVYNDGFSVAGIAVASPPGRALR